MTQERDDYMRRQEMDHDLLRMRDPRYAATGPSPSGFSRSQARRGNFAAQAANAEQAERSTEQLLRSQGWQWDDATRQWTHPDFPGATISA